MAIHLFKHNKEGYEAASTKLEQEEVRMAAGM